MKIIITVFTLAFSVVFYAQKTDLKKDTIKLKEVLVTATRATKEDPFTQTTISKKQLEKQNLGQDIPQLLNFLPNVVTTSDAGTGIGYTGIRVRGSDASRVNVTINGIPLNDSESQGTFWVDLPDFASSVSSIQLQRGVGTSTNGAGAFGASLSLATDGLTTNNFAEIGNSYGSYNTHKHHLKFGTGTINNHFNFTGRISKLKSDGYVDRAFSDLESIYLEGNYFNEKTSVKALFFTGSETTYQSWYGVDKETLKENRTFNSAGAIYDDLGEITSFYNNQVDDYKQEHYQLHINHQIANNWIGNLAFHYTYGSGYYEEYKQDQDFLDYGFTAINIGGTEINTTDLVRRKWLKNDFYGTTFSLHHKKEKYKLIIGGAFNNYIGDHFGKVIWSAFGSTNNSNNYYDNTGKKTDANVYAKLTYKINSKVNLFGDLQYRNINYKANGTTSDGIIAIEDDFHFFNPKFGINYNLTKNQNFYLSYARANKEPKRSDYEAETKPKSEALNDIELGWRFNKPKTIVNANLYYMSYKNQLVLTGKLNDVGTPIAKNIGKSYRFGLEIDALVKLNKSFKIQPNISISKNKNIDKIEDINGVLTNLGNTDLPYSPKLIIGNRLSYSPKKELTISLLSKHVGSQFLNNIENNDAKLDAYFVNDINFQYVLKPKKAINEVVFTLLINNILNKTYESNGADYGYGYVYYFPQAKINFLSGITFKF